MKKSFEIVTGSQDQCTMIVTADATSASAQVQVWARDGATLAKERTLYSDAVMTLDQFENLGVRMVELAAYVRKQQADAAAPTSDSGETLRGIYKLQEEMCELGVVLAKFGPFPDGHHPSPEYTTRTLYDHLREELADVEAALEYFKSTNAITPDPARVAAKLRLFRQWGLTGLPKP